MMAEKKNPWIIWWWNNYLVPTAHGLSSRERKHPMRSTIKWIKVSPLDWKTKLLCCEASWEEARGQGEGNSTSCLFPPPNDPTANPTLLRRIVLVDFRMACRWLKRSFPSLYKQGQHGEDPPHLFCGLTEGNQGQWGEREGKGKTLPSVEYTHRSI